MEASDLGGYTPPSSTAWWPHKGAGGFSFKSPAVGQSAFSWSNVGEILKLWKLIPQSFLIRGGRSREKLSKVTRCSPSRNGRARARSARARAQPRLKPLAGLRRGTPAATQSYRLGVLLRGLSSMRSHCSSSCRLLWRSTLSRLPMLSICLQCLTLSSLTRFPFHDSQVSKKLEKCWTVAPEVT